MFVDRAVRMVARRILFGKKRDSFISLISAVSLFGVCLGVAALVVVMGVMEGFESELRNIITGTRSHVILYSSRTLISDFPAVEARIRRLAPEVEAVSPIVFSEVMISHGSRVVGSTIEGIDPALEAKATRLERHILDGAFPEAGEDPTIVIGSALAERLGAKPGDHVSVITPFFEQESMRPRARSFRVNGIFSTGMWDYDSKFSLIHATSARDFFRLGPKDATALKLRTSDPDRSVRTASHLKKELGYPFVTRDWTELNRNLLYAIRLQKAVIFVILTAIIVVAAFNIMSTLMMMMSEKKREMSILKAMGMSGRQSSSVFMLVGGIIGVSGAVAGVALGCLLGFVLSRTRFIHLPPDVYFISYLPVDIRPSTLLVVFFSASLIALLATLYPSWQVAAQSPVEGLRYE